MSPSQFKKAFTRTIGHTKSFSGKANKVVGLKDPKGFGKDSYAEGSLRNNRGP